MTWPAPPEWDERVTDASLPSEQLPGLQVIYSDPNLAEARWPPGGGVGMTQVKTLAEWMAEKGIDLAGLVEASALDGRVVEAIACGRYTPGPQQRLCLSAALGVDPEQVAWGHLAQVENLYGHGPQFGRSP